MNPSAYVLILSSNFTTNMVAQQWPCTLCRSVGGGAAIRDHGDDLAHERCADLLVEEVLGFHLDADA